MKTVNIDEKLTSILEECLGRVGFVEDEDEIGEHDADVRIHIRPKLDRDFSDGPRGVVAHRYQFWVEVLSQDGHEFRDARENVLEAGLGKVA